MNQPTARWTTLLATTALVALPALTFAQDPSAQASQSPTPSPSAQQTAQAPASQSSGMDVAKSHLTTARNTLSELTQLPAAGQLQGDLRTQVAQLINNFNELITTQSDWKASYTKVEANLDALLATPAAAAADDPNRPTGTAGAVGTSGKSASLDPTIRAKLVKLRGELDEFEKAARAPDTAATPSPSAAPAATAPAATPPAATPPSTTATTTSSTTTTTSTAPAASQPPSGDTVTISSKDAIDHIDAIEVILGANADAQAAAQSAAGGAVTASPTPSGSTRTTVTSSDVKLTPEQMSQLKAHLTELRRLIEKQ
jgi:hypothetical protein